MRAAYGWVRSAAGILKNRDELDGAGVKRRLRGLVGAMSRHRKRAGDLEDGVAHFLKVTRSYWPGLFQCYDVADLPRTNNELEHCFGSARYNERRATGRKVASPAMVVRGSVKVVAGLATRLRAFSGEDIRPADTREWKQLRSELDTRRATRRQQLRFRRDPGKYLAALEKELIQPAVPS